MRLIDADELKVYLQEYLHYEHAIPWVDAQPTAYDVEKVVEQLEDMKKEETEGCSTIKGKYCSEYKFCGCCIIDRAISIVRKGGGIYDI